MKDLKKIIEFIRNNPMMPYESLAKHLGFSSGEALRTFLKLRGTGRNKIISGDMKINTIEIITRSERKELEEQIRLLKLENEALKNLHKKFEPIKIEPSVKSGKEEATAFILASDWHIEEEVKPSRQNRNNMYNLKIAEERACRFWSNAIRLLQIHEKEVVINNVVICLLGDFISGNIHEELQETNLLDPINAILKAQQLIGSGLELFKKIPQRVHIVCKSGNHARITKKKRNKNETGLSLEHLMYKELAMFYPEFVWQIDEDYLSYLDVYGYTLRVHHGTNVLYNGGIGGITIPMNKAISGWNSIESVDYDIIGHFHQKFDGGNFIMNGSLIGYNEFSVSIKAKYEPPQQVFFLLRKGRGKGIVAPIDVI